MPHRVVADIKAGQSDKAGLQECSDVDGACVVLHMCQSCSLTAEQQRSEANLTTCQIPAGEVYASQHLTSSSVSTRDTTPTAGLGQAAAGPVCLVAPDLALNRADEREQV